MSGIKRYDVEPLNPVGQSVDESSDGLWVYFDDHASEIARLRAELEMYQRNCDLLTHKVITCGVAASHPDACLASRGAYKEKWDSPQAEEVRKLRAEADALRVDSERLNWLESQVKEYGDGHYSRLEASLIFFWQQTKPDEVYPGFRESIDAAMGADA